MRIGLIDPRGVPDSRETDLVLERLITRLQEAGHHVQLCSPADIASAADAAPLDLYVTLVSDRDGNVSAASVSLRDATILLQTG